MTEKNPLTIITSGFRGVPLWILFILLVVIIGNLASLVVIDVHPDEAYYWTWSVYPDYSYYDHPPMIGWMIWLVSKFPGINDLTLRLPALISWAVAIRVVYTVSCKLYSSKAYGWGAAAIFCMLPVFQAASHIVTPDSPLLLFTALAYYGMYIATTESSLKPWLLTGACVGLALLSKYNAVLLPLSVFIGLLLTQGGRKILLTISPWAAVGVATIFFLPVILWNYYNEWISFSYQLGHGVKSNFSFEYLGIYIGGQLGSALIWIMLAMMVASFKLRNQLHGSRLTYIGVLVAGFWVPLLFFGYAGSTTIGEVNWPAMAYLPGTILLAGVVGKYVEPGFGFVETISSSKTAYRVTASILVFSCLFSVFVVNLFRFPVESKELGLNILPTNTQLSDTFGWKDLQKHIREFRVHHRLPENCRTYVSTKYMWASMAYRFRDVNQFGITPGMGVSQYEYWVSKNIFSEAKPCMVIERLPLNKSAYKKNRSWSGLGNWVLTEKKIFPTSDTPRLYGFYLSES